jgi:hypothetical protein
MPGEAITIKTTAPITGTFCIGKDTCEPHGCVWTPSGIHTQTAYAPGRLLQPECCEESSDNDSIPSDTCEDLSVFDLQLDGDQKGALHVSRANTPECRTIAETACIAPREKITADRINSASAAAHVRAAAHRMEHEQLCRELPSSMSLTQITYFDGRSGLPPEVLQQPTLLLDFLSNKQDRPDILVQCCIALKV